MLRTFHWYLNTLKQTRIAFKWQLSIQLPEKAWLGEKVWLCLLDLNVLTVHSAWISSHKSRNGKKTTEFLPKHSIDRVLCELTGDRHNLITHTLINSPTLFSAMLSFLTCLVDSFDMHFIGDADRSPVASRVTDLAGGGDLSLFVPWVQLPSSWDGSLWCIPVFLCPQGCVRQLERERVQKGEDGLWGFNHRMHQWGVLSFKNNLSCFHFQDEFPALMYYSYTCLIQLTSIFFPLTLCWLHSLKHQRP